MSTIAEPTVQIQYIGTDALWLETEGLTDFELLKAAAGRMPKGVNLHGSNAGPVWVHPMLLMKLAQPDGFGLELQGLAHSAAELLRLAADPEKAEELGGKGVDRLINLFMAQARGQAQAKRPNQLHAYRWGGSAKVVAADRVEPGTVEIHPHGNVAARLSQLLHCPIDELENKWLLVERHPFVFSCVVQIRINPDLTKNLILANRLDWRRALQADCDGDTGAVFPIKDELMAIAIREELEQVVPESDITALILDRPCHTDAEWWGEVLEKSTTDKLEQSFTKSTKEWIASHITMGDYANKYTPFAYRISDIGAAMAAVGMPGGRLTALIGATIEETFYLGLGGGPKGLDAAMETWFRKRMTRANQAIVFDGLRTVLNSELMSDREVLTAIARASAINRGRFDENCPEELLVHAAFQVGKGRISLGDGTLVRTLADMASDPGINPQLRESFIVRILFHAGRKLSQVVGYGKPEVEEPWEQDGPDWGSEMTSDFEE